MQQSHRLIYNTFILWLMRVLRLIPDLLLLPLILRQVGQDAYGVYVLAWSLTVVVELAQVGLSTAVVKYGAACFAERRMDELNRILSAACAYCLAVGVLGCLVISLLAQLSRGGLWMSSHAGTEAGSFAFFMVGLTVLVTVPVSPYLGILQAMQRHDLAAVVQTGTQYLRLLLVLVWFAVMGPSLESLMIGSVLAFATRSWLLVWLAYRLVPGLHNRITQIRREVLWRLFSFGGMILLCTGCTALGDTGMKWMMGCLVDTSFVAHMSILLLPAQLLSEIVAAMTLTVMPAASQCCALAQGAVMKELLVRGTRYVALAGAAATVAAVFALRPVLAAWLGSGYVFLSGYALVVLSSAAFLMSTSCAHHVLRGTGHLGLSLLNSVVGIALVPPVVAAVGTCISGRPYGALVVGVSLGNIVYGVMQIVTCSAVVGVPLREVVLRSYVPVLCSAGVICLGLLSVEGCFGVGGVGEQIAKGMVASILCGLVFCICFSTSAERNLLKEGVLLAVRRVIFSNQGSKA